jgi:hypothetical protein
MKNQTRCTALTMVDQEVAPSACAREAADRAMRHVASGRAKEAVPT